MAEKAKVAPEDVNVALERAKGFWAKYSKPITYTGSAVIVLILGWFAYKFLYRDPNNLKASEQIFPGEKLFDKMVQEGNFPKDTVGIVLNGGNLGDNKITGMLSIIKNYGGTPSGNRAQLITGACYVQLGQFDKAIPYLKDFEGNGATQVQSKDYTLLGHAYAEQKKNDEALNYYKKAADVLNDKDEEQKVNALFLAANFADYAGKPADAKELLNKLKDNFASTLMKPSSPYGPSQNVTMADVDKLLAKLGVVR
ncbi:MAG: tetratricopeptide repeat protein [Bacteroidetes bacterium]|nr:tetratricopeptide repeat protein [Bacteroidota bacterium]